MANPLPELSEAQYDALKASIEQFGIRVPILVDEVGEIIDGHHRRQIADELGIECPTITTDDLGPEEKLAVAATLNLNRRHMSMTEKKAAAVEIAKNLPYTGRQLGAIFGVDQSTVARWLKPAQQRVKVADRTTDADATNLPESTPEEEPAYVVRVVLDQDVYAACLAESEHSDTDISSWIAQYLRYSLTGVRTPMPDFGPPEIDLDPNEVLDEDRNGTLL